MVVLINCVIVAIHSVCPSGADLATSSAPISPEAPARLSTTTCWPHSSVRRVPSRRAMTSGPEPMVVAVIMRMGLAG